MTELALVASLFGPLFVGLVFHGLCIKFGWLRLLAVPIGGRVGFWGGPLFWRQQNLPRGLRRRARFRRWVQPSAPCASASATRVSRALDIRRCLAGLHAGGRSHAQRAPQQLSQAPARHRARGAGPWSRGALLLHLRPGRFPAGGLADRMAVGCSHV